MARLAKRMDFEFDWPGGAAEQGLDAWENPEIPSGYTYLLQLVAHDTVSTSLSIAVLEGTSTGVRNARSGALRLDTIYDGGPAVCPIAFQPDDASGISRSDQFTWSFSFARAKARSEFQESRLSAPKRRVARFVKAAWLASIRTRGIAISPALIFCTSLVVFRCEK